MTATRLIWVALACSVGCGETVKIPIEIDVSDPSCQEGDGDDGFSAECAASVEVLLFDGDDQTRRQCIELTDGLDQLSGLASELEDVSFPGLAEGAMVQMVVSVFSQAGCMGQPFVTGTSELATLDDAVSSIVIELECSDPGVCGDQQDDFVAVVQEIFGDQNDGAGHVVSVGHSTNVYTSQSALTPIGNSRFSGQLTASQGCVSVALDEVFGELPYVSCLSATGQQGSDHFSFAASQPQLVEAFGDAGLDVPRTVLGKVVGNDGNGVDSVAVTIEDDVDVLYYDAENQMFVNAQSTFANGIFAIRPTEAGCCVEVTANNTSVQVQPLTNGVAAARIVLAD